MKNNRTDINCGKKIEVGDIYLFKGFKASFSIEEYCLAIQKKEDKVYFLTLSNFKDKSRLIEWDLECYIKNPEIYEKVFPK